MNIEIGDSVKIVNAIDPIKMVVIDKIDNEHLTAVYWSHTQGAYLTITGNINAIIKYRNTQKTYLDNNIRRISVPIFFCFNNSFHITKF